NSANGREGLLLSADALYMAGGSSDYIKAEGKYRDFQNRFPTSDRAAYVQYQIANCLSKRMEKPDRDQTAARKALDAYSQLEQLFPDSEYASEAKEQIRLVKDNLAEHEFMVAHFYLRYGLPKASVSRLEYLIQHYPGYSHMDKVLYYLGLAYKRSQEPKRAQATFDKLRTEFPKSSFISDLPKKGDKKG
ncbi:MAG TPA: outer membrane protein assembly factor BamD, partial [Thermoanaerobaculia bacterium]|nr:outer membrane protein assembly factor BamD [Thermoanaerobaculia bacterium]